MEGGIKKILSHPFNILESDHHWAWKKAHFYTVHYKKISNEVIGRFFKNILSNIKASSYFNKIVFDVQVLDIETDLAGVVQKGKKYLYFKFNGFKSYYICYCRQCL